MLLVDGGQRLVAAKRHLIALYIVNLLFAWFASLGLAGRIGAVTGTSLYSEQLVRGFSIGVFLDLVNKPEVTPYSQVPVAVVFTVLFLVFQLFLTGGILTQYLISPQRIEHSRFYAACGENFWKLVRVTLLFVVVAVIVGGVLHAIRSALGAGTESFPNRHAALALQCGMLLIEMLVLLWLRMWFDLVQVQLVATDAHRIRSSIASGFRLARGAFKLYGSYVLLAILTVLVCAFGVYLWWSTAPPNRVIISFLILQAALACLLLLRWWQRALAAAWYQRNTRVPIAIEALSLEPLPPQSAVPDAPLTQ